MANRKLTLLSKEITDLLIRQLAHELKNYSLYRSFANYFSVEAITDLEEFYLKRATEEYNHHEWIFTYLSEADCKFTYPATAVNTEVFTSYVDPFKQSIDREILTTQMIYEIMDQAISEKDYMTCSWLYDKLIKEQIEEENLVRMACKIMEEDADIYVKAEKILELLG